MAALPMSCLVRLRLSRMMGDERGRGKGGDETGEEGEPREVESSHVRVCQGEDLEDLTGNENLLLAVGSEGSDDGSSLATEKAKVCSLPVTPCMEVPGEPVSSSAAAIILLVVNNGIQFDFSN